MGYKKLVLRDGLLNIEKYYGIVDIDEIINADAEMYTEDVPKDQSLLILADLSAATFPNISYEDIDSLFAVIDDFTTLSNGMKHAFYTGMMDMESFNKAHHYIELGSKKALTMVPFTHLDVAMDWLGLNEIERQHAQAFLEQAIPVK